MSEELAEAAGGPRENRKEPGRRTGRAARTRRPKGQSHPGDAGQPSEHDSVRDAPEAGLEKGTDASQAQESAAVSRVEKTQSNAEASRAQDDSGSVQPAGLGPADARPDVAQDKRRARRRPSRSRSKPARPSEQETERPESGPEPAPAPVLPDIDTKAVSVSPPSVVSPDEQGQRSKIARRRRRGTPRRTRGVAAQIQSAPLKMLIAAGKERNQIAVLRERELIEHYVSHDEDRSIAGNIYVGRVQNVLPGMEAAFLDIGEARNAVLYAGEVSFDEEIEGPPPRIESMLKSGQSVLAQVTKDPMGSKGARLTTEVSLAGRYVVLVPGADSLGISRRLADDERKRLRDIANRVRPPGQGLIVRTAADGVSEGDLEGDIGRLVRIWSEIDEKRKNVKPPKLLYSEPDLAIRGIRDLFTVDVVQVIVDDPKVYEQIRDYLTEVAPVLAERVELYEEEVPLFEKFQVVEQLRKAIDRKVWLKSGGHIVIDRTEAMTVIDVNTGRFVGKSNLETTVLHANLEAAEEIAKQLRLRDIGGIIVIDFIDMMHERNRQELVRTFEAALQRDKTRTQVFGISELGLLQMTRKNVSEGLLEAFSHVCETCEGRGIILTDFD